MTMEELADLPILLLGTFSEIRTVTRLEKMAFLADNNTFKKNQNYSDWEPNYYGPYSKQLIKDVANYERKNIIKIRQIIDTFSNEVKNYSLTIKGRQLFSKMLEKYNGEQFEIKELLGHYQSERTNYKILKFVYENYPDYLAKSRIKKEILG